MNAREFVVLLRKHPRGRMKAELAADIIESLADQGEALERQRHAHKEDAVMAWAALGKTLRAIWCDVLSNPEPRGEGPDHETVVEAVAAVIADTKTLLIEEQQARHAAGTRVSQLEHSLALLVNNTNPPPVIDDFDTDAEADAAVDARNSTAAWYRSRIKLALASGAAVPPSPAGASGQPSGSTPAASSATFSSSEAAGNPSAPHGTLEGGAA